MPVEMEGVDGEGELAEGERVEERGIGGAESGGVVGMRRVDLEPGAGAWVVGEGGGDVQCTGVLDVHGEPWLDGVDVAEGDGERTVPGT